MLSEQERANAAEFANYRLRQRLAAAERRLERLQGKQFPGDELSGHFVLGTVGGAGRASRKLNRRRENAVERIVENAVEIRQVQQQIARFKQQLEAPLVPRKPQRPVRTQPEPTARERAIYTWYFNGGLDDEPDPEWTEADVQAVRHNYRGGMRLYEVPAT